MEIVTRVADLQALIAKKRTYNSLLGFVPTMGYLHEGHTTLIDRAKSDCKTVVVSIFVNPTQFGVNEDIDRYPRDLTRDIELCRAHGVDILFCPEVIDIYPRGKYTWVDVEGEIAEIACGAVRPGHFRGVATVCTKLFNIIHPDRAYFGEKDFQQLAVIKRVVNDLFMPIKIVPVQTVRERDGLAKSSRNSYLSPTERQAARIVPKLLAVAKEKCESGVSSSVEIVDAVKAASKESPMFDFEYAIVVDDSTFEEIANIVRPSRILIAGKIGKTRLIDNIQLIPCATVVKNQNF